VEVLNIFILTFIFGTLSNQFGGLLGFAGKSSEKSINKTIGFTAGITTSIICFELLKESFEMSSKYNVVLFTIIGVIFVKLLDFVINQINKSQSNNDSLVIVSAMSAHNITEGIAIGSAFKVSSVLGFSLLFAIMLHNIPEGMIIGSVLKKERKNIKFMLYNCLIIGIFLAVGSTIGATLGDIDDKYIMPSLALSAGAMLYMLACDLIPNMYDETIYKSNGIIYIIGFLIGCIICKL